MDKLLIDISRLVGRLLKRRLPTGIDRVGLAYVRHYGRNARALLSWGGRTVVCGSKDSQALFGGLLNIGNQRVGLPLAALSVLRGLGQQACGRAPTAGSILLNTGHGNLHCSRYLAMLRAKALRPVFLVHDLIPISHPQFCRQGEQERHRARMSNALRAGSGIICNSRSTLNALEDFAGRSGLAMPPALAAPLSVDLPVARPASRPLPSPYFILLGTIEPRKNHLMLLQVWQRIAQRLGASAPRLVMIGQRGWESEHIHRFMDRAPELQGCVIHKERCGDVELASWLAHAQALLFPTFAEGFGVPVIEALASGLPVIASDLPVFREFAGDIPEYVDPLDALRWAALIEAYSSNSDPLRAEQIRRLRGFVAPDWSDHFGQVDEFLHRLAPGCALPRTRTLSINPI